MNIFIADVVVGVVGVVVVDYDDDDDDGGGGGGGNDDVGRICTGPYAVRSAVEHQVNHNAKIFNVYHMFSSHEEGGPTSAGKSRCLAVTLVSI